MLCCQNRSGIAIENGARRFGENTECDLPLITAQGQMAWLNENLRGHLKPELILWTGDSVSHGVEYMTEKEVLETVHILSMLITETYPEVPIVFSLGNHDFEPSNTQKFSFDESAFLKDINQFWVDTLPETERVKLQFQKFGFYSSKVVLHGRSLLIVSINT